MSIEDNQLEAVLLASPSLSRQMILVDGALAGIRFISLAISSLLAVKLPFLAHPAYRVVD